MDVAERMCERVFMIYKGNKVLDGTVDEIQRKYPADEVKLRLADGSKHPSRLPGVVHVRSSRSEYHLKLQNGRGCGEPAQVIGGGNVGGTFRTAASIASQHLRPNRRPGGSAGNRQAGRCRRLTERNRPLQSGSEPFVSIASRY